MFEKLRGLMAGAVVLVLPVSVVRADEAVLLKDADEKVALGIRSLNVASGGQVSTTGKQGVSATVGVTRARHFERRFQPNALGGELRYQILRDEITTELDGERKTQPGPLHGKLVTGQKNGAGNWVFSLVEGSAVGEQVNELELLGAFENKRWLPGRKVKVGESWDFTPRFIRQSLKRDLPSSEVVGVMKLEKIRKAADGSRQALIHCVIRGGGEETAGEKVRDAQTNLSGVLTVNLDRPGELEFRLSGSLVSGAQVGAAKSTARMPLTLTLEMTPLPGQVP